jgi:DNA-3-methyladenine glycosylase
MEHSLIRTLSLGAVEAAPLLIGAEIVVGCAKGIIVEVEAYTQDDPASHSYNGIRPRNRHMFLPAGHLYVYQSYGVHLCTNLVTGKKGIGEAILLRSIEPIEGLEEMRKRRQFYGSTRKLCAGPGNLTKALGICLQDSGGLLGEKVKIFMKKCTQEIGTSPRIGITKGIDLRRRYFLMGSEFLSRTETH